MGWEWSKEEQTGKGLWVRKWREASQVAGRGRRGKHPAAGGSTLPQQTWRLPAEPAPKAPPPGPRPASAPPPRPAPRPARPGWLLPRGPRPALSAQASSVAGAAGRPAS